jgi:hypothetical protein
MTMRTLLALGALTALILGASPARAAGGFQARGFWLPDGAVKVDEDRYRLPQPWDDAVKFYRATYPPAKFPRRTLRNQSGVRAMHIGNSAKGEWEGANLYETPRGEVRVFVLPKAEKAEEPAPPMPPRKAEQPKPRKSG